MKKKKLYSVLKMFILIKKRFFIGSLFLSSLVSTTPLSCISGNNQACKIRPEITNVNCNNPYFILLVSKQVNVVVVVTISMILCKSMCS